MREVDFNYLRSALESLNSSTDLVLERGMGRVTLSHQCSPYISQRPVRFVVVSRSLAGVLRVVSYRKILLAGLTADAVAQAAETIGRAGRPFDGSQLGLDRPWARGVGEPVSSGLPMLHGLIRAAYG